MRLLCWAISVLECLRVKGKPEKPKCQSKQGVCHTVRISCPSHKSFIWGRITRMHLNHILASNKIAATIFHYRFIEQWRSVWNSGAQPGFCTAQVYRPQVTHHQRISRICDQVHHFWWSKPIYKKYLHFQAKIPTNVKQMDFKTRWITTKLWI